MNYYEFSHVGQEYIVISALFFTMTLITGIILIRNTIKIKGIKLLIYIGFLIRLYLIIHDNFVETTYFSHPSGDGVMFNEEGYKYLIGEPYLQFSFVKLIIGPLYKMFGMQIPSLISSLNVLASLGIVIILYKIITENSKFQNKSDFKKIIFLYWFSIFTIFLNVAFLREAILNFFFMGMIYYYFHYFNSQEKNRVTFLLKGLFCLGITTYLHSGMIFLSAIIGYKYYSENKSIKRMGVIILIAAIAIISIPFIQDLGYFRGKNLESMVSSTRKVFEKNVPGSIYIYPVYSIQEYLKSLPLRYFYFLFSPTPNLWRGFSDILAFFTNAIIYIILIFYSIKRYIKIKNKINKKDKTLIESLIIGFLVGTFIYSVGTITSGTAIRHRDKFFPLLLVIYYLLYDREKYIYRFRKKTKLKIKVLEEFKLEDSNCQ